jgi:hypothetical protein
MLFILAMEPLHLLFKKAQDCGLLCHLNPSYDACRVSLYTDDAVMFINPSEELHVSDQVLQIFAQASGLCTNMTKTHYFPTRCEGWTLSSRQLLERIFLHSLALIWAGHLRPKNHLGHPCCLWFRKRGVGCLGQKKVHSLTQVESCLSKLCYLPFQPIT